MDLITKLCIFSPPSRKGKYCWKQLQHAFGWNHALHHMCEICNTTGRRKWFNNHQVKYFATVNSAFTIFLHRKHGRFIVYQFNPLTPVLPVTAHDEPWPFFLFWRHRFWPKLASSILNFCGRKRSFQWCPDQSDQPNGALDMHKNAQKVEWKAWSKISCHYTWMLYAKNYPFRWRFLRSFLTASKPSRRSITAAKTREKETKGEKKIPKIEKPKDVGHFLAKILISAHVRVTMH